MQDNAVDILKQRARTLQSELNITVKAIRMLDHNNSVDLPLGTVKPKRTMSAAARAKIAKAQRNRWTNFRSQKKNGAAA
jgi:hypothetical protein